MVRDPILTGPVGERVSVREMRDRKDDGVGRAIRTRGSFVVLQ